MPLFAQVTAYAVGQPGAPAGPSSIPLSIPVTASVGGRCGFATTGVPNGSHDFGAVDRTSPASHDFAFTLECTGPSRVAVVSTQGGLRNGAAVAGSGYTNIAAYDVTLNLVGSSSTATASCTAAQLVALASGCTTFRGPASLTQGLRLASPSVNIPGNYLRVTLPAYAGTDVLMSGNYQDTLTITVSPST